MTDPAADGREKNLAVIRSMIQHEDLLLNQRLTRMWTLHGLLLASSSVLWEKDWRPLLVIAVVGFLSCVSIGYSMGRGIRTIRRLLSDGNAIRGDQSLPGVMGARVPAYDFLLPGYFFPWLLAAAWVALLVIRLFT